MTMYEPNEILDHQVVAQDEAHERVEFYRRTYGHVAGAFWYF